MNDKFRSMIILLLTTVLLSGCTEINEPITKDSTGVWNELIVYPLSWLMVETAQFFGEPLGYGLSIILITVLIRLAILPLMIKQIKSTKAMQVIQPELAKLQEKYKSKDAITRQKLQQERLLLMEKYNINPMAGCLPLFIQMPILLGFYQAIMRTEELKGNSFIWFELASPDPYFLLPILAGVSTFIQQKVMTKGQEGNPQIVMMLWLMPVMIIIFSLYLPSALPLYWIVGNIFSIIQSYFIQTPEITNITTQPAVAGRTGGRKK